MGGSIGHVKRYVVLGFWAVIPVALSFFAIRFLYLTVDQRVVNWIDARTGLRIPGMGLVIVLLSLYLLGLVTSNVVGRKALGLVERITDRLPLVKTIYRVGKQLADTFSKPESEVFRHAVLVEYLKPGIWTVGFVTGSMAITGTEEMFLKVYIPTPPNPTSGTLVLVRKADTRDPGWTIDEAMKLVISAGIIGPKQLPAP